MWYVILLAGGSGSRMGAGKNKVLLELQGEPVICRAARAFTAVADGMVVVARDEDKNAIQAALEASGLMHERVRIVSGGATRQDSVWNGLQALPTDADKVLIHDGARCLVDEAAIRRCMDAVKALAEGRMAYPKSKR